MKVIKKWLIMGKVNGKGQIIGSAHTKKEAIELLTLAEMEKVNESFWKDSDENLFFIEKNIKEYGRG